MDAMLTLAIASAVSGWAIAFHFMRQRDRFRVAWRNQCELRDLADSAVEYAEKERIRFRDAFAFESKRAIEAERGLKCALETKKATEEALADSEKLGRECIDLCASRWHQIQELQAQLSGVTK